MVTEPGAAIWLTSDLDEAQSYSKVVLAIPNNIARKYKFERWSGYPHGYRKQYGLPKPDNYHMVIKANVPLKYWKLVDPKTRALVKISDMK